MSTPNASTVEILTIGDELLRGELLDSNSAWLAERLHRLGLPVSRMVSVGDGEQEIQGALRGACERARLIITSGGLGPTDDDRTAAALAAACERPLVCHEPALRHIHALFTKSGMEFTPNNEKQALIPQGAEALMNMRGTAPGIMLDHLGARIYCLPGVPHELRGLYQAAIEPWIIKTLRPRPALQRTMKLFGIGESKVDHLLEGVGASINHRGCAVSIHYRTSFPENHVTVLVRPPMEPTQGDAEAVAISYTAAIKARLGRYLFGEGEETFSGAMVGALRRAGVKVALAESCTAGLAGDLLTRAPGSSEVFELGMIAYANHIKEQHLRVPAAVLQEHGAVSQACVEAMAQGVRGLAGADYGVAISGVAGPGGGSADKPVGTVHFAVDGPRGVRHLHRVFPYDRQRNKVLAAHVALWLVYRQLSVPEEIDPLQGQWKDQPTPGEKDGV
ncbi:MAG: CinA family nicotinamide mononucleotide deamidase-related protein [Deltaproteobacteria bacterium]|nr:CinA family nicotinamide mononucleotide deamidase-related protein [Deltaproteobacteria bacterium]